MMVRLYDYLVPVADESGEWPNLRSALADLPTGERKVLLTSLFKPERMPGSMERLTTLVVDVDVSFGDLLTVLAEAGEQILSDAKQVAQKSGVGAETVMHHSFTGRVCDVVIKEATDWKADLIVIGTHGRRGAGRFFLGSDAEQVLRLATVPVLLVRDPGKAG